MIVLAKLQCWFELKLSPFIMSIIIIVITMIIMMIIINYDQYPYTLYTSSLTHQG